MLPLRRSLVQPQLVVQRILRQATPTATRRSRIAVSVLQTRSYLLMPTSVTLQAQRFFSDDTSTSKEAEEGIDRSKFTEEIKVYMPEMGEGEGKILKWYKQEGDLVLKDDILCDIETKDFSFGMVTDDNCDAIMGKILVAENSETVQEKSVICTLFHPKHDDDEKSKKESE